MKICHQLRSLVGFLGIKQHCLHWFDTSGPKSSYYNEHSGGSGVVVSVLHFAVQNGFIAYCSTCLLQQNKAPLKKFNYQFLKNHLKKVWICSNFSSFYAKELLTKQLVRPVTKLFERSLGRVKEKKETN